MALRPETELLPIHRTSSFHHPSLPPVYPIFLTSNRLHALRTMDQSTLTQSLTIRARPLHRGKGFLDLPYETRSYVYRLAGVIRLCPIYLDAHRAPYFSGLGYSPAMDVASCHP